MGRIRNERYSISATDDDGRECTIRVCDRYSVDGLAGTRVETLAMRHVHKGDEPLIVLGKGRYRSMLSGKVFVSDDPHAPG